MSLVLAALLAAASPDAARLWDRQCSSCHGDDGRPDPSVPEPRPPDLTDRRWQSKRTDSAIKATITNGVVNTRMLGFKDKLTTAEIDALVAWVRKLKRK